MKFPSPCGEKVGINSPQNIAIEAESPLFPSPCGEKVGINLNFSARHIDLRCFRPLAGKR